MHMRVRMHMAVSDMEVPMAEVQAPQAAECCEDTEHKSEDKTDEIKRVHRVTPFRLG